MGNPAGHVDNMREGRRRGAVLCAALSHCTVSLYSPLQVATRSKAVVSFGETELDLAFVEQLVEKSQTRTIADSLLLVRLVTLTSTLLWPPPALNTRYHRGWLDSDEEAAGEWAAQRGTADAGAGRTVGRVGWHAGLAPGAPPPHSLTAETLPHASNDHPCCITGYWTM